MFRHEFLRGCDERFSGRGRSGRGRGGDDVSDRGPFGRDHEHHGFGGRGMRGGFGRGFGGGRERMFDAGQVRLVILKLLSHKPSYGYQLMKNMEETLAGGYTPSAGVIYPTLTMLEEEGLTASSMENNKKVYSVTPAGLEYLKENEREVERIFVRLEEASRGFERERSPEIMRAFMDLRGAVVARVSRESVSKEKIRRITEIIHDAAKAIDEL